jgi:hypothetical protein
VGHRDHLGQALFAGRGDGLHVVLENPFERLLGLPLRVLGREGLHPVEGEDPLEVHRLLAPERAVVIERRDARFRRDELGAAAIRDGLDELDDALLDLTIVPGRQGIRLGPGNRAGQRQTHNHEPRHRPSVHRSPLLP